MRTSNDSSRPVVIDVAGAFHGGAARFLGELDAWIERDPARSASTRVVGRGHRLDPQWLVQREWAGRGAKRRIALNNASFWAPSGDRLVLLRNALHFASQEEMANLGFVPSRELRAQIPVIRALVRRADQVIVPCSAMGERVLALVPSLKDRLEVRGHPVSVPAWRDQVASREDFILVPIVPAPYKNLDQHIRALLEATEHTGQRVVVTATAGQLPLVKDRTRVDFVGLLSSVQLQVYWQCARSIYYPTGLEAFGYPLAEARVLGRWIIARNTGQNREIAGPALAAFEFGSPDSLRRAVELTLTGDPDPDPGANDPDSYFAWLIGESCY